MPDDELPTFHDLTMAIADIQRHLYEHTGYAPRDDADYIDYPLTAVAQRIEAIKQAKQTQGQ
jgi:hypothetical protein